MTTTSVDHSTPRTREEELAQWRLERQRKREKDSTGGQSGSEYRNRRLDSQSPIQSNDLTNTPLKQEEKLAKWRLDRQKKQGISCSGSATKGVKASPNNMRTPLQSIGNKGLHPYSSETSRQHSIKRAGNLYTLEKPPLNAPGSRSRSSRSPKMPTQSQLSTPKWVTTTSNSRNDISPLSIDDSLHHLGQTSSDGDSDANDESPKVTDQAQKENDECKAPPPNRSTRPILRLPKLSDSRGRGSKGNSPQYPETVNSRRGARPSRVFTPNSDFEDTPDESQKSSNGKPNLFLYESPNNGPPRRRLSVGLLFPAGIPPLKDENQQSAVASSNQECHEEETSPLISGFVPQTSKPDRTPDSEFDWRKCQEAEEEVKPVRRRTDSAYILLPIPSLRKELEAAETARRQAATFTSPSESQHGTDVSSASLVEESGIRPSVEILDNAIESNDWNAAGEAAAMMLDTSTATASTGEINRIANGVWSASSSKGSVVMTEGRPPELNTMRDLSKRSVMDSPNIEFHAFGENEVLPTVPEDAQNEHETLREQLRLANAEIKKLRMRKPVEERLESFREAFEEVSLQASIRSKPRGSSKLIPCLSYERYARNDSSCRQ